MMLDDDVRLRPGLISHLLQVARAYGVEAVNAAVYRPGETLTGPGLPYSWPAFASGACLVSAAALIETGGFDERLEGGYGEDYEIGVRLPLAGAGVLYAPGEPILHLKAPAGGFRAGTDLPWSADRVPPRPAPTVLYSRRKHHPAALRDGYRLFYALKRLSGKPILAWPRELRNIRDQWEQAVWWVRRMESGEP
jgi:hypothetical protein